MTTCKHNNNLKTNYRYRYLLVQVCKTENDVIRTANIHYLATYA